MARKPKLFCDKHKEPRTPKKRVRYGKEAIEFYCKSSPKEHSDKFKEYTRDFNFKKHYGIGLEEYNSLFEKQNECCAICERHQSSFTKRLAIDHIERITGEKIVRGLLCSQCNQSLGLLQENAEIALKAASYIATEGR